MYVKGTAFIARQDMLVHELGKDAYESFLAEFAERNPMFRDPILATSRIPAEVFLAFNDEVIDRFFRGDRMTYWRFGEESGEYLFHHGPYKDVFYSGDYTRFLGSLPNVWRTFYSEGECSGELDDGIVDIRITGVPVRHLYFEYTALAFIKRGLELTGSPNLETKKLKGFSSNDDEVHYRFVLRGSG